MERTTSRLAAELVGIVAGLRPLRGRVARGLEHALGSGRLVAPRGVRGFGADNYRRRGVCTGAAVGLEGSSRHVGDYRNLGFTGRLGGFRSTAYSAFDQR